MALIYRVALVYALMADVVPSSATSLRHGHAVEAEQSSDHHARSSLWPFNNSGSDSNIKNGVTFERTETSCPLISKETTAESQPLQHRFLHFLSSSVDYLRKSFLGVLFPAHLQIQMIQPNPSLPHATFENGHCQSSDQFGGNDCHFNWGEDFTVNYDGQLGDQELNEDVYIEMSLSVDSIIHHSQTCPVCGNDPCKISIANRNWSLELPPCPIASSMLAGQWKTTLPNKSPVPQFLSGSEGTTIEGSVWLKRRDEHNNDGEVLVEVKGNVHLK